MQEARQLGHLGSIAGGLVYCWWELSVPSSVGTLSAILDIVALGEFSFTLLVPGLEATALVQQVPCPSGEGQGPQDHVHFGCYKKILF